jgi:hypothetical protein
VVQPIGSVRNDRAVLGDMLQAERRDRDLVAGGVGQVIAE